MARSFGTFYRKFRRGLRLNPEPSLIEVPDRIRSGHRTQLIPPTVYHTAPSRLTHPLHHRSIESFRDLNPTMSFLVFDDEATNRYMESEWSEHPIYDVYSRCLVGQMRADIFRYCIVFDRGGYYFDFNKSSEFPLESLHPADAEAVISYERNVSLLPAKPAIRDTVFDPLANILQWGFGFSPKNPALKRVIDWIVDLAPYFAGRTFAIPKDAVLAFTGPGAFTAAMRLWIEENGLSGISEAGVDFGNSGPFRLRGSSIELKKSPHYSQFRNAPILSP